jgi:hypothetical protein
MNIGHMNNRALHITLLLYYCTPEAHSSAEAVSTAVVSEENASEECFNTAYKRYEPHTLITHTHTHHIQ